MKIEELFEKAENKTLTLEQFQALAKEVGAKFVDLKDDGYVSKNKYSSELEAKDKLLESLNETLKTREDDLQSLQEQLENAGTDADQIAELLDQLSDLRNTYDMDTKAYKKQLESQAYEFAVKEFANSKNFSSKAAKRDFVNSLIAKGLKMQDGNILGAEDFVTAYSADNADAFIVEPPTPSTPILSAASAEPKPQILATTPGAPPAKPSLSNMMKMANDNPGMQINF